MNWNNIVDTISQLVKENADLLRILALGSLGFFLLTPILAPAIIILMPADILIRKKRTPADRPFLYRRAFVVLRVLKNALGVTLTLLGILLLFMPGQGLLTIFLGLMFTDLPGKRELLIRLLGGGKIRPSIDRLRQKYEREPLEWPEGTSKNYPKSPKA